jgi:beta-mannanase
MKLPIHYLIIVIVFIILLFIAISIHAKDSWYAITWTSTSTTSNELEIDDRKPQDLNYAHTISLGGYSLEGEFDDLVDLFAVDHYFVDWDSYDPESLQSELHETISRDRWPLVTVEPFASDLDSQKVKLLEGIVAGNYDATIAQICSDFSEIDHPILIRFMHEMDHEANIGRYPWVGNDPKSFIAGYQYFVDNCRDLVDETYYVWSPVGSSRLQEFYPGDNYVDLIGLSLYSFPSWELDKYGKVYNFDDNFKTKYESVSGYNKKIILAEFAVARSGSHQENFLYDMRESLDQYPLLDMVVYFNSVEPFPEGWGFYPDTEIDWRIENTEWLRPLK